MNLGICIAPTQPFRAALGAESRVCYQGNTADRQTEWALTYYHLSQSTANQNGKWIHGHRWDSNLWPSGCWRTFLTTRPSPTSKVHSHCLRSEKNRSTLLIAASLLNNCWSIGTMVFATHLCEKLPQLSAAGLCVCQCLCVAFCGPDESRDAFQEFF
jgi:hypothetical protein